jgi:hypothetical protein
MGSLEGLSEDNVAQPWRGEPQVLHPHEEVREELGNQIHESLVNHMGAQGILASELAEEIAHQNYDPETGTVRFTTGDVKIEIAKRLGTTVRMAPNRRLYPK